MSDLLDGGVLKERGVVETYRQGVGWGWVPSVLWLDGMLLELDYLVVALLLCYYD